MFISLSLFIFSGVFSCFFQLGVAPLAFSFYLLFSASLNLGETVTCILKGYSYVGVSCCRRHMLKAFDGRAGSDAGANHVFPQSVLAAITLVRLESEDRVGPGCEAKHPLWSVAIPALLREGSDPLWSRRPVREA